MTAPDEYRRATVLAGLPPGGRGIELGALDNPIAQRPQYDVLYVDHADTATIRTKYATHRAVGDLVDVDIAWCGRLRELIPQGPPINWAIASHVVEHVPDVVGWLDEIAEVVEVDGVLSLVVPDHRYCFDVNRAPSRPSEVIGAAVEQRTRPSAAQLVEFHCVATGVDTAEIWRGESDHATRRPSWRGGYDLAIAAWTAPEHPDCHCWTFTPATFLDCLEALFAVGWLTEWIVDRVEGTPTGFLEFYVVLRRVDPAATTDADRRASVDRARAAVTTDEPVAVPPPTAPELSLLESRLIASKRRVAAVARRVPPVSMVLRRRDDAARSVS